MKTPLSLNSLSCCCPSCSNLPLKYVSKRAISALFLTALRYFDSITLDISRSILAYKNKY